MKGRGSLKDDDSGDHDQNEDSGSPKECEKEKNEEEEKDQNKRKTAVAGVGEHPCSITTPSGTHVALQVDLPALKAMNRTSNRSGKFCLCGAILALLQSHDPARRPYRPQ
ncbi:hypothetical protein SKAU_G00202400 [Synaphobranchus kaupii]|uniref:Uncharacterized protein n=1 Tax=Synaphobranchus kaupii TaxID=118154 RepID=A0A9Q1IXZ4_SYNKA|nr:hypothetical protein SKAU_G00202400 [Synaphobranchus kaupii]